MTGANSQPNQLVVNKTSDIKWGQNLEAKDRATRSRPISGG